MLIASTFLSLTVFVSGLSGEVNCFVFLLLSSGDLMELVREFGRQLGWSADLEKLCTTRNAELEVLQQQQPPPSQQAQTAAARRPNNNRPTAAAGKVKPASTNVPGRLPQHRNFSSGSRTPSASVIRAGSLPRLPPVVPNSRRLPPRYSQPAASSSSSSSSEDSSDYSSEESSTD